LTELRISLFGSPVIELNGEPIQVDTRKAIALFAYLAVTQASHNRDHLATLLWPDYDQSRARAALRRTLSPLKKALGGKWLHIERDTLALEFNADVWLDVVEFRRLLAEVAAHDHSGDALCTECLAKLAGAVDLYKGDFLAGFTLRDSPIFDDWQFFETESLRKVLAEALEKLVHGLGAGGDYPNAIKFARQWSALDLLHEGAQRQLMLLYAWSGERAAAIRQYRECVRILDHELGVPPLEETTGLYQQIMEDRPPSPPSRPSGERLTPAAVLDVQPASSAGQDRGLYPLVGREAGWEALTAGYQKIQADGRFLVIEGEAGIGKTRLAIEFLTALRAQGCTALIMRCYEGEAHLAYSLFLEGLRAAVQNESSSARLQRVSPLSLREAARLLPELALQFPDLPEAPPLEGPGGQSRFLEGLRQLVEALCSGPQPGVLFLDDVHWADEASLDLLTYLVRRLRGLPLFLLVTWRSEGVPARHRLRSVLGEALRSETGGHLTLSRLGWGEVVAIVEALPQPLPEADLAERLYAETEGLPHFVVEYLDALRSREPQTADFDWSPPDGVRDLLRSRLSGVGEAGQQFLTTGAAIGRSFTYETLLAASGRSEEEAVVSLEDLVARGLFVEVRSTDTEETLVYDFSHEQLRQLVYADTSFARRRLLHRRIASSLLNRSRDPKEIERAAGQIAYHYHQAGHEAEAAGFYRLAGEHARTLFANTQAIAHYRTALALGYTETAELHESIGDLQTIKGMYQAARSSFETAAALDGQDTLSRLDHKLGIVHHRLGEWERAEGYYQAALSRLVANQNPEAQARIFADWSLAAYRQGDGERAAGLAQQALASADEAGVARGLAQVNNILGILARSRGELDAAHVFFSESLEYAESLVDLDARIAALNNLALVHAERDEIPEARGHLDAALQLCVTLGDRHREAALLNNLADLEHKAGEAETSMRLLKEAVAIFTEIGSEGGGLLPEIWKLVEW
jgi:DNA-binding SARP family transcriptional activator